MLSPRPACCWQYDRRSDAARVGKVFMVPAAMIIRQWILRATQSELAKVKFYLCTTDSGMRALERAYRVEVLR